MIDDKWNMENERRAKLLRRRLIARFIYRLHHHAKPEIAEFERRGNSVARAGAALSRVAVPRAAANYFDVVVLLFLPPSSILRRLGVAIVPGVETPFPDVAVHVVKSEGVRRPQTADRDRLLARGGFLSRGVRRLTVIIGPG